MKSLEIKAFTLAEVLITLSIIGVIAALTIPNLLQKIQDNQLRQAAKEAYSKSSQAVQNMRVQEGGSLSYYKKARTFKPEFIKYFKILKNCEYTNCVYPSYTSNEYKTFFGSPANTYVMDDGQFITQDGMFFAIDNPSTSEENLHIWILVDVNGLYKKPNVFGKDVFAFQVINDNLIPLGTENSSLPAATYCNSQNDLPYQGLGCSYYAIQDIKY